MTNDVENQHGSGTMGSKPSQGVFLGFLGLGLIAFSVLSAIFVLMAGSYGA